MQTHDIINLAIKHVESGDMKDSAKLCLDDAKSLFAGGKYSFAKDRAIDSMRYSVGVFHPDYVAAWNASYEQA